MIGDMIAMVVAALMTVPGAGVSPNETVPVMAHNVTVVEAPVQEAEPEVQAAERGEMRGVWVTTVINLDWPSRPGLSNAEIKREIDYIVSHTASLGLNTIFLQVRPEGDAIYPSEIFPWSRYLTGEQGRAPADGFDPLQHWLDAAHAAGLELHAWLNPYRVTHSTSNITNVNSLYRTNPARLRPDLVFRHERRPALYWDPGFPENRQLIVDGVIELLQNYPALDGIHLDDYFYPSHFNDDASFAMHGWGNDRALWRRNNVNLLVQELHEAVRQYSPHARFGISPTGIWQNRGSSPLGSDTRGNEHYRAYFADSLAWVREGWVDYLIPQIYWHIGFDIACYEVLLNWWAAALYGSGVDLYIGHAAWREHEGQANFSGEMLRQLQMNEGREDIAGSVFFRWANLRGGVGDVLREWYGMRPQEPRPHMKAPTPPREPLLLSDALTVVMPSRNVSVNLNAAGHNIWGASIPDIPLLMNGELVEGRTPEGFFSLFAELEDGDNVFEFSQPGQPSVTRTISRVAPVPPPPRDSVPPAAAREYSRDEPFYATVSAETAWLFPNATETGGTNWMLERGMRDRVIASAADGNWLRLSNGGWIRAENVTTERPRRLTENVLSNGRFSRDGHIETVTWRVARGNVPAARAVLEEFNGIMSLKVYFGMQTDIPVTQVPPEGSIFGGLGAGETDEGIVYMIFIPMDGYRINGFDITGDDDTLTLTVMTPRPLYPNWRTPFYGFTFVIDPGHGGSDVGALGPMGAAFAEKHINLTNSFLLAERLENLGAEVHLFRETNDNDYTLRERVMHSRGIRPDMFISMHANSVAYTTDATNIRGFTVWYRNENSYRAARTMLDQLHYINPGTNRWKNPNQANFYVCRPTWAPSILLETSFMSNIDDFVWMITPDEQARLADETVVALMNYYLRGQR